MRLRVALRLMRSIYSHTLTIGICVNILESLDIDWNMWQHFGISRHRLDYVLPLWNL